MPTFDPKHVRTMGNTALRLIGTSIGNYSGYPWEFDNSIMGKIFSIIYLPLYTPG